MKKILAALLLMLLLPCLALADEQAIRDSVVRIYVPMTVQNLLDRSVMGEYYVTGSGFAVGKKGEPVSYIVTNKHVLYEIKAGDVLDEIWKVVSVDGFYVVLGDISSKRLANDVQANTNYDLAVLRLIDPLTSDERIPAVLAGGLGEEFEYEQVHGYRKDGMSLNGMRVWTAGFPGCADSAYSNSQQNISTKGSISLGSGMIMRPVDAAQSQGLGRVLQHNATQSGGNSGGPLVEEHGYVVGVNTWTANDNGVAANVHGSILVDEVMNMLDGANIRYEKVDLKFGSGRVIDAKTIIIGVLIAAIIIVVLVILLKKPKPVPVQPTVPVQPPIPNNKGTTDLQKGSGGFQPINGGGFQVMPEPPKPAADPAAVRMLVCDAGALKGKSWTIRPGDKYYIGYAVDDRAQHISIPNGTTNVSHVHCVITFDGKTVTVRDHDSTCGTLIRDIHGKENMLLKGGTSVMHRGNILYLGSKDQAFSLR